MAKNLVIVESPAKSKTLSRFLGKDFEILSTVGHIVDLPKSKIGVDTENDFTPEYITIKGKEKVITELKKAAKKADTIFLAPDPDREGEAIAWHVANTLKGIKAKFVRVAFNEITKAAVTEAIKSPREIDINLVNAQQARRVLDRLVGYNVSPFLWKTVARNLSAGRVQSVALRLVCEREAEVTSFKEQEYWNIKAELENHDSEAFTATLAKIDNKTVVKAGEKMTKTRITIGSKKEATKIVKDLQKLDYVVSEIKKTKKSRHAAPPFITSSLQQEAARVCGFSPRQTMSTAQKLYEGIEIGKEGPTGLITYMRTDSTRISAEALKHVRGFIKKEFGEEYLPAKGNFYSKKKGAQDAHEAIRPTYMDLPPEKVKKNLTAHQFKLYRLIWNRFVASQMTDAKYDAESVSIEAGQYLLRASAQKMTFDGFLKVYQETSEPGENGTNGGGVEALPDLSEGEELKLVKLDPIQSFTKPPGRFSEAMLVKRLEADGIGRPSTYATIISTLRERKYVELKTKKLHPTELGQAVNKILIENFPDLFNVAFTANMEQHLDGVEDGTDEWVTVVRDCYSPLMDILGKLKGKEAAIKRSLVEKTDIKCENCESPMEIKWGRNGRFLSCSAYPECKTTKPLPEEEAKSRTKFKCEKCGKPMVIKTGRFGRFMACSGYPDCKNTKPLLIGVKCPKDGCGGDLTEKGTKSRRTFYGCTNYPKCDFASWDKPVDTKCPSCGGPYMLEKVSKTKGDYLKCPACKNEVIQKTPEVDPVS